jgi:alpha-D-ribose 1-methylphosphonate 5-triphosphate synthase subunit PhnH
VSLDLPGFADPVADAQRTFRAVLDAMAHPGRVHRVGDTLRPPAKLHAATAALLLSLADADTPVWLAPGFSGARAWIVFHTGAPIAEDPMRATFAVATSLPDVARFSAGSDEAPESSATLIVQVAGFASGQRLRLAGPGLRVPGAVDVAGLPIDFATIWAANHALYPRGVDVVLVAGTALVALPRGVRVERG